MRSGRVAEATPRLFRGAAEAKARGAPDEAVLALESALPHLAPDARTRARVVLADLHQELGRWLDSLQVLEEAGELPEDLRPTSLVLDIEARWNLGEFDDQAEVEQLDRLLRVSLADGPPAGKAYLLGARIARDTGSSLLMTRVLGSAPPTQPHDLLVQVGNALLHFHMRDIDESARIAEEAAANATRTGRRDSTAVRLFIGLAALRVARGDYEGALLPLAKAGQLADRLDNDSLSGQVLANEATVLLRLGRYDAAIRAGDRAAERLQSPRASGYLIQAIEACGIASAVRGQIPSAMSAIRAGDAAASTATAIWRFQDWLLEKADILWTLGDRREALSVAKQATSGTFVHPGDPACAGQHARWVARLSLAADCAEEGIHKLGSALPGIENLDALDSVEILAGICALHQQAFGFVPLSCSQQLSAQMAQLCDATCQHLAALGVIPFEPRPRTHPSD
jgi:tetratricopeptide (TPR) repeat protein